MAEFMTFRRWAIHDANQEAEVVALVRDVIVPTYQKLPGCLRIGLLHIVGTNTYLATQHWVSKTVYAETLASPEYAKWREAYEPALTRWHELMTFEDEWETEDVLYMLDHE
jgi:quinol monooxygenase YgiN